MGQNVENVVWWYLGEGVAPYINRNKFKHWPTQIMEFQYLSFLDFSKNLLTDVPHWVGQMKVKHLNLAKNLVCYDVYH